MSTVNLAVLAWVVVATLAIVAVTAAMVWPLAVRHGRALERVDAGRDIIGACLAATTPMDILAVYANGLRPPDPDAYADDLIAKDPALDRLTRHPEAKVRPPVPPTEPDEKPATVDEPVWRADADGILRDIRPPLIGGHPPHGTVGATSHRTPRRPLVGWFDETLAKLRRRGEPVPDETPDDDPVWEGDFPPPPPEPLTLADGWRDDAAPCGTCKGTLVVTPADGEGGAMLMPWPACPDCCCPEPGCGTHTGGGLCDPHQHDDDIREEAAAKRNADV